MNEASSDCKIVKKNANVIKDIDDKYEKWLTLCQNNVDYFTENNCKRQLNNALRSSIIEMHNLWPIVSEICEIAPKYDFDENTPGNGFYGFLVIVNHAVIRGIKLNKQIFRKRASLLFKTSNFKGKIDAWSNTIATLIIFGSNLKIIYSWLDDSLCPKGVTATEYFSKLKPINLYGLNIEKMGFQFCKSIRPMIRDVCTIMAIESEKYYSKGSTFSKTKTLLSKSTTYLLNSDEKKKRIIKLHYNADIEFLKKIWFLPESGYVGKLHKILNPKVEVSRIIKISPEPLSLTVDGKVIDVPIPQSFIGKHPIHVRLVSHKARKGMLGKYNKSNVLPPSRGLIIHCHGGGCVAQTSKSHENYLRQWANILQAPIFSIDYSLLPQAPYPRALEEVTYAYCWALKNLNYLGTTGERIVVVGDSAGGNLALTLVLKCISMGVPTPNGVFLLYAVLVVNFLLCPSRHLCCLDPLLPLEFGKQLIKAYAGPRNLGNENGDGLHIQNETEKESENNTEQDASFQVLKRKGNNASWKTMQGNSDFQFVDIFDINNKKTFLEDFNELVTGDYFFSPHLTPDEVLKLLPPVHILTMHLDPFVDDCVEFAKKLKKVGNNVSIDILDGLPHGFLNFIMFCKESYKASEMCGHKILELLDLESLPERSYL